MKNNDLKKKWCKQNSKCRKTRMSELNYEFLDQSTRMEGKNSYCVVKCVIKCVINEQCNRWSPSFCRAINCFTFDTFLLNICCFAKMDMNRKKTEYCDNAVYLEP